MKAALLRLSFLVVLFAPFAPAQTVYWSRLERLPASIDALDALTPAADKIPYFTSGTSAGLITVGGNLSLTGGTLNLSATPNIGVATGTSLLLSGNSTVGGGGLIGSGSTLALTGSGSTTFRLDLAPTAANSSASSTIYNQPLASAGTASYARIGLLSGTNSRNLRIDTGGNGGATAGDIEIAPGSGSTTISGNVNVTANVVATSVVATGLNATSTFGNINSSTAKTLSLLGADAAGIGLKWQRSAAEKPLYVGALSGTDVVLASEGSIRVTANVTADTLTGTTAATFTNTGTTINGSLNVSGTNTSTFGGSIAQARSVDGSVLHSVQNTNAGTGALAVSSVNNGAYQAGIEMPGSGYTTVGPRVANRGYFWSDGAGGMALHAVNGHLRFWTGNPGTERATIDTSGVAVFNGNLFVSGSLLSGTGGTFRLSNGRQFDTTYSSTDYLLRDASSARDLFAYNSTANLVTVGAGGAATIKGTTTNDNAATGYVGEYVSSSVASGSAISLTNNTAANVTSISLTAGDWDVTGIVVFSGGATTGTQSIAQISDTSAAFTSFTPGNFNTQPTVPTAVGDTTQTIPSLRVSVSGTVTRYLVVRMLFSAGTPTAYGTLTARRVR